MKCKPVILPLEYVRSSSSVVNLDDKCLYFKKTKNKYRYNKLILKFTTYILLLSTFTRKYKLTRHKFGINLPTS